MGLLDRLRRSRARPGDILEELLLVPTPDTGREPRGFVRLEEDEEISLELVHDSEGLPVLPAFTSEAALTRWKPDGSSYVGLPGRALLEIIADSDWDRIVVDSAGPRAFAITRTAAQELLRSASYSVPAGSTLLIGQPAELPPDGFIETLRSACERRPGISEGYVYQLAVVESDEWPHVAVGLVLGTALDPERVGRLVEAIGDEVRPQSWGYDSVDFQVLDGETLDMVRATTEPFFRHG